MIIGEVVVLNIETRPASIPQITGFVGIQPPAKLVLTQLLLLKRWQGGTNALNSRSK